MKWTLAATRPRTALALALVATLLGAWATTTIEARVDFVDAVPASSSVDMYRHMLEELDGVRFVVIHMPLDGASHDSLRSDDGFDALVAEQQGLTEFLEDSFPPGTFSHTLSVYEAMRAGNYMLAKIATAGNPPASSYSLPDNQVTWAQVRDEVRASSGDDVLAQNGQSALLLAFLAEKNPLAARDLAGDIEDRLAEWIAAAANHPATKDQQASGLLIASHQVDERNRTDIPFWATLAAIAVAAVLLFVVRRPGNVLAATASLAAATSWTFGIMGLANIPLSFLTLFLAPLVMGVGIDYAVHVLHRFEEERDAGRRRAAAVSNAVAATSGPVALAALTTMAGLALLLLVPAPLFAEIGAVGALGIGMGFVASVTVAPAIRALLPSGKRKPLRDGVGTAVAATAKAARRHPRAIALSLSLLVLAAGAVAATQTRIESGEAENEFPADDPAILLRHRIEDEYGAFERAYIVVAGDIAQPEVLQAILAATNATAALPLYYGAAAVTDLLVADESTNQGAADILTTIITRPEPADRMPATPAEARDALDALFADPLWRTIAPFTITRDYQLAVIAIQLTPWSSQQELVELRAALRAQAAALADQLPAGYQVEAAGAPLNRAAVIEQTPRDVAVASVGVSAVVGVILAYAWQRRGLAGLRMAAAGAGIILAASVLLLGTIPILDAAYDVFEDWGAPANSAALTNMFLLAFAVTAAVGIDDIIHVATRYWAARDAGAAPDAAIETSFRHAGRAITGTSLTTFAAFAILAGVYFLQSKNLAILTALGVLYAYLLTLLIAPLALAGARAGSKQR